MTAKIKFVISGTDVAKIKRKIKRNGGFGNVVRKCQTNSDKSKGNVHLRQK